MERHEWEMVREIRGRLRRRERIAKALLWAPAAGAAAGVLFGLITLAGAS
jgi:hypothetical protein